MDSPVLPALEGTTLSGQSVLLPRDLPAHPLVLVIGFTHGSRQDVGAWKAALGAQGVAYLSLPTSAVDLAADAMGEVAQAMRARVPREGWDQVVQIHQGGESLLRIFGWEIDVFAKVVRVDKDGKVLACHNRGPFTKEALAALIG